ncbi:MAG: hypothetical protein WKG07_48270 [Hymenobacter sp.]
MPRRWAPADAQLGHRLLRPQRPRGERALPAQVDNATARADGHVAPRLDFDNMLVEEVRQRPLHRASVKTATWPAPSAPPPAGNYSIKAVRK